MNSFRNLYKISLLITGLYFSLSLNAQINKKVDPTKTLDGKNANPTKPLDSKNANPTKPLDGKNANPTKPLDSKNANPTKPLDGKNANPTKPLDGKNANPTKPKTDVSSRPMGSGGCNLGDLPTVSFPGSSVRITPEMNALLFEVSAKLKASPECKVKIMGYGGATKVDQQLSWDRVNAVKNFLVLQTGISSARIIISYGNEGDPNTVDLIPTTEDGPNTLPAPHPNLREQ